MVGETFVFSIDLPTSCVIELLIAFANPINETPEDALDILGASVIESIEAAGGAVAAPYSDPYAPIFPWWYTTGGEDKDGDLLLMDEVVACAIEQLDIDLRRIYSVGFAEGAMNTTQVAVRRSGYIASIAVYSAGYTGAPQEQLGVNAYPVMILHGGETDVYGSDFYQSSIEYYGWLQDENDSTFEVPHFAFMCDHNLGHAVATDAQDSVWQFLQDHPYGTAPSPYADALPASFPSYCSL